MRTKGNGSSDKKGNKSFNQPEIIRFLQNNGGMPPDGAPSAFMRREFYSVIDTLYELNNLWMLSEFIPQNQQVLFQETRFISGNTERHRIPEETGFYGNQQNWERHHAVPDVPGHGKVPYG